MHVGRLPRPSRDSVKPASPDAPASVFARITATDTPPSPTMTQRRQIARIVARESAETLVGRSAGLRVEVVRRLIRPIADHIAGRFVAYDGALGGAGLHLGSAWIVDHRTGGAGRGRGGPRAPPGA